MSRSKITGRAAVAPAAAPEYRRLVPQGFLMFESTSPSSHPPPSATTKRTTHSLRFEHSQCDCPAHRAVVRIPGRSVQPSLLAALAPLLVCAFCPACMTLWAPLLASIGLGFALPESVHSVGLGLAILAALAPAAWHARRAQFWQPVLFVVAGAGVFLSTHAFEGGRLTEVLGALSLVLGSSLERRARRNVRAARVVS